MGKELVLKDQDGDLYSYDNIKTQGWLEGHFSGLEIAANYLKDLAVKLFQEAKHDKAIYLQKLADDMVKELEPKMRSRAKLHEKEFPDLIKDEDEA